jgi:branched-subunit amino acid permease
MKIKTSIMKYMSVLFLAIISMNIQAQRIKNSIGEILIPSAVPMLLILVDARSSGMGGVGVATSTDNNSGFHNP